ncbi:MAG: PD-(D/E)XK nuclease family protein [Oscillospiraceae bacterium]|nr:PD-(D/E)XK nuclease family protein [Oscillospiraceae bacterium]
MSTVLGGIATLNFILGPAGSGKTALLLERLAAAADGGARILLLVPEQYSFEAELAVQQAVGPRLALEVEVLSFTRLCNSIFRALGGMSGPSITPAGRYLLLSLALAELTDKLRVYKKSSLNPAFLETISAVIAEFKGAGISPDRLSGISRDCPPGGLGDKLADLSALYSAYQALLEQGYTDSEDDLIRAINLLRGSDLFAGKQIFVDGFTTFMAGEFEMLSLLIAGAGGVTVAFTADEMQDNQQGMGIFSSAKEAMARLRRYARQAGVQVASPVKLHTPCRYHSPALAHLATSFSLPNPPKFGENPEAIRLFRAEDPYREIEWVASQIAGLVREDGCRYREIALVARETEPYLRAVESVFLREGIPFFTDERRDVENVSLAGGLLAALEAIRSGLDGEAVLAYAKNPLPGFDPDEIAALEGYSYIWSVRGKLWEEQWQNNPRGMVGPHNERDREELIALNATRQAIIAPLAALRDGMKNTDGRGFAGTIYAFLRSINAAEHLQSFADGLSQGERETFLDESTQLWDCLMDILDVFGTALATTALPAGRFVELFRLALGSSEIGLRPQTLDQVLVGKADRIRPGQIKAAFVIGGVEGQFPPDPSVTGVFTEEERRQIAELGAEIGGDALARAVLERFYCYYALTIPSQQLFVSYPAAKLSGAGQRPSWMIARLCEIFPKIELEPPVPFGEIYSRGAARDLLAGIYREESPRTAALIALLGEAAVLRGMERAAFKGVREIADPAVAKALFGERMTLSPSRIERYHRCAFSYFARDGLGLRRRERVEFTPLESGSVLHHVLQVMTQRHGRALFDLSAKELKREIAEIIDSYLADRVARLDALPNRFHYLFLRLSEILVKLLRRLGEEFNQSEYMPVAFELPIGLHGDVRPLEMVTAEGNRVRVEGVVDRVDVMQKGENRYLRVVDYKSGGKQFRLDDVICGLNLQMLLYLFTIAEKGEGALAGCVPAGVLYMPVGTKPVTSERGEDEEMIAAQSQKQWKMSGLLLDDEESLRGMERELKGVFIPAKMGKDGLDARSALAGKAEMGRLSRKIRALVGEMADCLMLGRLPATPLRSADFDPCDYCEMGALCGFEPGDTHKTVAKMDRESVLKMLGEDDHAGLD